MEAMAFPVKELIEFEGNIYEFTCVASKRAYQIAKLNKDSPSCYGGEKEVSMAARQVFTHEVKYSREDK